MFRYAGAWCDSSVSAKLGLGVSKSKGDLHLFDVGLFYCHTSIINVNYSVHLVVF